MKNKAMNLVKMSDVPLYSPPCTIKVDEKYITIHPQGRFEGMYGKDGYWIEKSRVSTPGKVLGWMNQLSGKNWMDAQTLVWFAEVAFAELGVEMDYRI